jgi:hypothetical protein
MGRKKAAQPKENLTEVVMLRLTRGTYEKLDKIRRNSDCRTVPDVVRRILEQEQIIYYHKDAALDGPMEILAGIKQELKAIGVNINQVTRYFNRSATEGQRAHHLSITLQHYKQIDAKVSLLLTLISQLARTWLQK